MQGKKAFYCASTAGHLVCFHLPYLKALQDMGWTVTGGAAGYSERLDFLDGWIDLPFEKRFSSPANLRTGVKLAKRLKKEKFDLICVHTSLAAFFVRLAVMLSGKGDTRVVNTVHGYLFDDHSPGLKKAVLLEAEKLTASVTDRLITMNACDTKIAGSHRLCRGDVVEIPGMGVDFSRFLPAAGDERQAARQGFGIAPDAFVMVYAAEFSVRKNQTMLINAMKKLPDKAVLLLPGTGDMLQSCKAAAEGLGSRVLFPGYLSDMAAAYHAADLCVSASRTEGLPFNVMEAMSCALPAAATAVKGHTDLITHGENGLLFPRDDEEAFADAVLSVMDDKAALEAMGAAARASVDRFSLENVYDRVAEALFGGM